MTDKYAEIVENILGPNEEILEITLQKTLASKPIIVAITNLRLIICKPKLIGIRYKDYEWRNVLKLRLQEKVLSSSIEFDLVADETLERWLENPVQILVKVKTVKFDSLPKKEARRFYGSANEKVRYAYNLRQSEKVKRQYARLGSWGRFAPEQHEQEIQIKIHQERLDYLWDLSEPLE